MKRRTAFLVACTLCSFAAQAQVASPTNCLESVIAQLEVKWPKNRAVNIVCHGHSVPAGYFKTPVVDSLHAYPNLLRVSLAERYTNAIINVIVTAIGGENSVKGAARFEADVLAHKPDVVLIDYALNDRRIGLAAARTNWISMIEQAQAGGVKIILLTPTPDQSAKLDDADDPLNQHAEQIRSLAAEFHTGLVDSLAAFKAELARGTALTNLMSQVNHPNARGHELVGAELLKWFSPPTSAVDLRPLHNPVWVSKDNLRDPSVLKTNDGYHIFYSRFSGQTAGWSDPENWHIAEAFTKDFLTFTNDRNISPAGCASPGDVVWWHGRWVLPYQTYPGKPTQLVFAESTNLVDWSAPQPFLTEALTLPWNELQRVIDPSFVVDGDTLHCWFVGSANRTNASGDKFKVNLMGHARTRDPKLAAWEILTTNAPLIGVSAKAPDGVENTMVFRTADHWTMIYSEGLISQHLARATSSNLIHWQMEGALEIPRQQWMTHKYGAPFVWRDGGQWLMILMGSVAQDRTTFGLLNSTDGEHWTLLPEQDSDARK